MNSKVVGVREELIRCDLVMADNPFLKFATLPLLFIPAL